MVKGGSRVSGAHDRAFTLPGMLSSLDDCEARNTVVNDQKSHSKGGKKRRKSKQGHATRSAVAEDRENIGRGVCGPRNGNRSSFAPIVSLASEHRYTYEHELHKTLRPQLSEWLRGHGQERPLFAFISFTQLHSTSLMCYILASFPADYAP